MRARRVVMREENEKKKPSACGALGLDRTMDLGTQSSLRSPPFLSSFAFEFESVSRFFFVLLWLRILYRFGAVRDRFLYLRIPLAFGGIRDIFPTWISCFYWIFFSQNPHHISLPNPFWSWHWLIRKFTHLMNFLLLSAFWRSNFWLLSPFHSYIKLCIKIAFLLTGKEMFKKGFRQINSNQIFGSFLLFILTFNEEVLY